MSNDYILPIVRQLTYNAGATLRYSVEDPSDDNDYLSGRSGRVFTGLGKWTTLASIGVFNCLKKHGLAEERKLKEGSDHRTWHTTPLGREVGHYLLANWGDCHLLFRKPKRR